ncbi:MAG: hypothetical protein OCD02_18810 [Spirochaetaceae bacterium]
MKQFCITPAMGKRLIGMGMAQLPEVKKVLEKGTLVIIAGTTNGYVAEEILKVLKLNSNFNRKGFRRGITVPPGKKAPSFEFLGDLIFISGDLQTGKTIFDVSSDLTKHDLILKGANAIDVYDQAAIQIGHPEGGTIHEALKAVYGRRTTIIYPVGMEKRVPGDLREIAEMLNVSEGSGPRLYPSPGAIFTELDALELLTGANCQIVAAGGIYGAEGSTWIVANGTEEQEENVSELIRAAAKEEVCEV